MARVVEAAVCWLAAVVGKPIISDFNEHIAAVRSSSIA